jgi:hypothetical protein
MVLPPGDDPAWGAVLLGCVMGCDSYAYRKAVNVTLRDASTWELPDRDLLEAMENARTEYREEATYDTADALLATLLQAESDFCASTPEDVTEEMRELIALREFADEYGSAEGALIRESYFESYVQQLVEDIGDMPRGFPSYIVIDWEATANNLRHDYSTATLDGVDYYFH